MKVEEEVAAYRGENRKIDSILESIQENVRDRTLIPALVREVGNERDVKSIVAHLAAAIDCCFQVQKQTLLLLDEIMVIEASMPSLIVDAAIPTEE